MRRTVSSRSATSRPGVSAGTMNADSPLAPGPSPVRAKTVYMSAIPPLKSRFSHPIRTRPACCRQQSSQRPSQIAAPECEGRMVPDRDLGSHSAFCPAVPNREIAPVPSPAWRMQNQPNRHGGRAFRGSGKGCERPACRLHCLNAEETGLTQPDTSVLHALSMSEWSTCVRDLCAHASTSGKSMMFIIKKMARIEKSCRPSVTLKNWLVFGDECLIGAPEIIALHTNSLGLASASMFDQATWTIPGSSLFSSWNLQMWDRRRSALQTEALLLQVLCC